MKSLSSFRTILLRMVNAGVVMFITHSSIACSSTEEGILPFWTGSEWVDGMTLVVNGFPVPKEIRTRLLNINFQERAFGAYFRPESERKKVSQFSGFHPTDRFLLSRITLENMGYKLEFDKTFYIWRITGTNAPATHSH